MKSLLLSLLAAVCLLQAQTNSAVFPAAVVTDADVKVLANDCETKLRLSAGANDQLLYVFDASCIRANMYLTIDPNTTRSEIVSVVSVSGTTLTVVRGRDGKSAIQHTQGAKVAVYYVAGHHNQLAAEIKAIETALGAGLANVRSIEGVFISTDYDFAAQTPGGSLTGGVAAVVTMSPCPQGVAGAYTGQKLLIASGIGTAETVAIAGGTCTSGAASGTIIFTPANNHSGAWQVSSASHGVTEALRLAKASRGRVFVPPGAYLVYPDSIKVWAYTALLGAARDQSVLMAAADGGTLVDTDGLVVTDGVGNYFQYTIWGLGLNSGGKAIDRMVAAANGTNAEIGNLHIEGGRISFEQKDNFKNSWVSHIVGSNWTVKGFYSTSDNSGEDHYHDLQFGSASPGAKCWDVNRSTTDDVGAYYAARINCGGANGSENGFSFVSTASGGRTPVLFFCDTCIADAYAGVAFVAQNVSGINWSGGWMGSINTYAAVLKGSKDIKISNLLNLYSRSDVPLIRLETTAGRDNVGIRVYGNSSGSGSVVFDVGSGTPDVQLGGNGTLGVGSPSTVAAISAGVAGYYSWQNGAAIITHPTAGPGSVLCMHDPVNNKTRCMRNANGRIEALNGAFDTITWSTDDSGFTSTQRLRLQDIPTSCAGPLPTGTLWSDLGTVKVCP